MASAALPHSLYIHGTSATNGGQSFAGLNLGTINYAHGNNISSSNEVLNAIPIAKDAPFNAYFHQHDPTCLPNTRVDLLREIDEWLDKEDSPGIFWLSGLAGTGKSTIAQTVATQYNARYRLAASFFFSRAGGDVSHAGKFVTSIAIQIANSIPGLKRKVCDAIVRNNDIASLSLVDQWQELVIVPLSTLEDQNSRSSYVIVIDALDECDNQDSIHIILQRLAEVCSLHSIRVRVLLTSRSEIPIQYEFTHMRQNKHQDFVLHDIDHTIVEHDISVFLKYQLELTGKKYRFNDGWPAEKEVEQLVEKSGGLFIWAATAWRFIDEDSQLAEARLLSLLHQANGTLPPERKLDEIYTTVLASSVQGNFNEAETETLCTLLRDILGPIVVLQDPLSLDSLAELLGKEIAVLRRTVVRLNSVLHVPAAGPGTIQLLHPSFRDFIIDQRRCTSLQFHIDERLVHCEMYEHCLRVMSKHLHRDMCNLQDPGALVAELSQMDLDEHIQPYVKYACQFWVHHCIRSDGDIHSCFDIEAFFQKHFLHWLETLSLLGYGSDAVHMIHMLDDMVSRKQDAQGQTILKLREKIRKTFQTSLNIGASSTATPSLRAVLHDATRFALAFRPMIEEAPLQLYYAGLLFSPTASIIRETFSTEGPTWFLPCLNMASIWNPCLQTLKGHVDAVNAVTCSQDGKTLASGDAAVMLWDAGSGKALQTGNMLQEQNVLRTLQHCRSGSITALAFSLDSTMLWLGCNNGTARLWDRGTGEVLQMLHYGHPDQLAFSRDSKTLASVSNGKAVQLWDTSSGNSLRTLKGHSVSISALAFSLNGKTLVSGSINGKVKLWDVDSGDELHALRNSNKGRVSALAFSPDGKRLASGFHDGTIQMWDAELGKTLQALKGHFSNAGMPHYGRGGYMFPRPMPSVSVNAVTFSPDNKILASGSGDKTIKLWETRSGKILQTLEGHSGPVKAVAFLLDSKTLASGSDDKTVKLWDVGLRKAPQTLQGHSDLVNILAFSPDSRMLASGSNDETVKLWETSSGKVLLTLKGRSGPINALAFSPDSKKLVFCDRTLQLWDASSGKRLWGTVELVNQITAIAFSPDGKTIAYGTRGRSVTLLDIGSKTVLHNLSGDLDSVSDLAFAPDGKTLACGSSDDIVELWDISSEKVLQTLKGHLSLVVNVLWPQLASPLSLSVEGDWIRRYEKKVLWIPSEYRSSTVVFHDDLAGFAFSSGRVLILRYEG